MHAMWLTKRHALRWEVTLSSEEIKPEIHSIICLAENVSKINEKSLKFHNSLLEGFRINLQTFLGLVMA